MQRFLAILVLAISLAPAQRTQAATPALSKAEKVIIYRVEPSVSTTHERNRFHGYRIIAGPTEISRELGVSLARALEKAYSVPWPHYYCAFQPVFAASFYFRDHHVDALMCPGCNEIRFYRNTQLIQESDFRVARSKVIPLYRSIYKTDSLVQSIPK